MLSDAHAHLDMLTDSELLEALANAKAAGVQSIVSCATSFPSNAKTLLLAEQHKQILPAIGLYPLDAIELNELELDKAFYFFEAEIEKAVAVGEVGLDFKYATKESEQQKQGEVLKRFIALSNKHKKPLVLHTRFAQKQVLQMLQENKAEKALLHSYVDSLKYMKKALDCGYFVSVGLSVLTHEQIQKNISQYPLEGLLLETDSPVRFGGEKAFPQKVVAVAQKVAELKGTGVKEVEEATEKNFKKLFI